MGPVGTPRHRAVGVVAESRPRQERTGRVGTLPMVATVPAAVARRSATAGMRAGSRMLSRAMVPVVATVRAAMVPVVGTVWRMLARRPGSLFLGPRRHPGSPVVLAAGLVPAARQGLVALVALLGLPRVVGLAH